MAYKINKISPSSLAATELCPRFRPDGKENDAAAEGTMLHECLEELVSQPIEQWNNWIATRELSAEHKGLLEEAARQLTVVLNGNRLETVTDYRLKLRNGKPRKSLLKPGLYPELEIERGQGRHGYIDLLVVMPDGTTYIIDYKMVRQEGHDYTLQLGAYACDINRLAPAHENFICRIIAPRLPSETVEEHFWGLDDIVKLRERIEAIEEQADRSANDDSIIGCPSDACQYCHWSGKCRYQASAAIQVSDRMDVMRTMLEGTPWEGETITNQTFTAPANVTQRGLRRAFIKFFKSVVDQWTDDDKEWTAANKDVEVPGWKIGWRAGRATLDKSRMADIRAKLQSQLGLDKEAIDEVSAVDQTLLKEFMVANLGYGEKDASKKIQEVLDDLMKVGGSYTVWTQVKAKKSKGAGASIDV